MQGLVKSLGGALCHGPPNPHVLVALHAFVWKNFGVLLGTLISHLRAAEFSARLQGITFVRLGPVWGVDSLTTMKTVCVPCVIQGPLQASRCPPRRPRPPAPALPSAAAPSRVVAHTCSLPTLRRFLAGRGTVQGESDARVPPSPEAWPAAFSAPPGPPPGLAC